MPTRRLPSRPDLDHLEHQARDLRRDHAGGEKSAFQRIREFHPRFEVSTDAEIGGARFTRSDALLAVAREYGFASWTRLRQHVGRPDRPDLDRPHHERIEDPVFRRAVDLIDDGDVAGLRAQLGAHPDLVARRVVLEGGNYFTNPNGRDVAFAVASTRDGFLLDSSASAQIGWLSISRPDPCRAYRWAMRTSSAHQPSIRSKGGRTPMTRNVVVAAALLGIPLLTSCTATGSSPRTAGARQEAARPAPPEYFLLRPEVEKSYGYTHAIRIGDDIKISGAVSMDDKGNPTAIGDLEQQMKNAYSDLDKVLKHFGCGFGDVIVENVYTTNMAEFLKVASYRGSIYQERFPTGTWVEVKGLALPEFMIEIELEAHKPHP